MTDHWLDDMLPNHGPADMPQRFPPPADNGRETFIPFGGEPVDLNGRDPYQYVADKHIDAMADKFKAGGIQVYSGGAAWPLDMAQTEIDIIDVAHALALKVRFTGHCTEDYKIAQHSCHVHDLVPVEDRREALLHDASEYVLPDVASPVKPRLEGFKALEKDVEMVIAKRFDLRFPFPPSIKMADNAMVLFERQKILKPAKYPWMVWTVPGEPANIPGFEVWSWHRAKFEFLTRAWDLGIRE